MDSEDGIVSWCSLAEVERISIMVGVVLEDLLDLFDLPIDNSLVQLSCKEKTTAVCADEDREDRELFLLVSDFLDGKARRGGRRGEGDVADDVELFGEVFGFERQLLFDR